MRWIIRAFHLANETNGNTELKRQISLREAQFVAPFLNLFDNVII